MGSKQGELEVRIVTLEPLRVAGAYGFGASPEPIAWETLLTWANQHDLIDDTTRFFGFNNPDPSPGSPQYGYEQWMTVGPDVQAGGEVTIKDFKGGQYVVTRCNLLHIGEAWQELVAWREDSPYGCGTHQWLEQAITPPGTPFEEMILDLYLPIAG